MASTGFWPVKSRLKEVIDYAENPDKTTDKKFLDEDLWAALRYVENDQKTDQTMYVSAINCPKQRAYQCMMATKRRYGKFGGNVAYHGYQSFVAEEVTPAEAHRIGIETAKRMWGANYEVVVTTHLNTDNIHNHFVINSVSFKTGRKFENHIRDHVELRQISDAVCKEHGKSVIPFTHFYGNKKAYWVQKSGKLTHRDMLRRDVDEAIANSGSFKEIEYCMKNLGYRFERDFYYEHPSVIADGWKRAIRISSLGEDYTKERIKERCHENQVGPIMTTIYNAPYKRKPLLIIEYEWRRLERMDTVQVLFALFIELLKEHGYLHPEFFVDDGISGTTFDRPDFQRMQRMAENGEIGTIIVKDLSRFGRETIEMGRLTQVVYPSLGITFIAIQENVNTNTGTGLEMMPFYNIFNEWYAEQTSKKIKAVWKSKADNGERVSSAVPFGYMKSPDNPKQWIIDEPAAKVVRYIFELCLAGLGPMKIARRLENEEIVCPTEYYYRIGRKATNKRPDNPYRWDQVTVRHILENRQYTGCTVNFKSTFVSFKVKKTVHLPEEEWQIIPNTQESIIDEDTFERVQELRKHRRRNSATGKSSMFAGLLYCADCGSKLYYCASKSIDDGKEFYRCSQYKENRGACTIHFIRDSVLKKLVLDTIRKVAKYVQEFEPVFLYLFAKQNTLGRETAIRNMKQNIEKSKQRIKELDMLIERIYEDNVLGKISDERFYRMSANYEKEQKELLCAVEHDEQAVRKAEQEKIDLKVFLEAIRECTDLKELTPTIVNTLIKRIDIHNSEKDESGTKHVPIDISFTAVGIINIPTEKELIAAMEEIRKKPLKSA